MMENLVFLEESISAMWLSPGSATWIMDMTLAVLFGLGLFLLLLPWLPGDQSSPPLGKKKGVRKMGSKVRKKSSTMKAGADFLQGVEDTHSLLLLLHRNLALLRDSSSFRQLFRGDGPGETFPEALARETFPETLTRETFPEAFARETFSEALARETFPEALARAGRLRKQPKEEASPAAARAKCPPPPASIVARGLKTSQLFVRSTSSGELPQPPEPPVSLEQNSSPSSSRSSPQSPALFPPDSSQGLPLCDSAAGPLGKIPKSLSPPNNRCPPSPGPAISSPLGTIPESLSPPNNRCLPSPGPAISSPLGNIPESLSPPNNRCPPSPGPAISSPLGTIPESLSPPNNRCPPSPGPAISSPLGTIPESLSPPNNRCLPSPGPAISSPLGTIPKSLSPPNNRCLPSVPAISSPLGTIPESLSPPNNRCLPSPGPAISSPLGTIPESLSPPNNRCLPSPGPAISSPLGIIPESLSPPNNRCLSSLGPAISSPLGTIPESLSPPNNSCPSSPGPAISSHGRVACPVSASSWWQVATRAWFLSSHRQAQGDGLAQQVPEASFWADAPFAQVEAGGPSFINPDTQEMLEIMISRRVEMKTCKEGDVSGLEPAVGSLEDVQQPQGPRQDSTASPPSWNAKGAAEWSRFPRQLLYHQVLQGHLQEKCGQLCWGLPILHSESLVVTVRLPERLSDFPSIFFNGLPNFIPAQVQVKVPHKPLPRESLPHVLVQPQPQPVTPALPSSAGSHQNPGPSLAQIPAQAQPTSPLPILASPAPPKGTISCPKTKQGAHGSLPPAAQHLEHHLLKKQQGRQRVLPSLVEKSQELFIQPTSKTWNPQNHGPAVSLPRDFINPRLREQLEQHLREKFEQKQCAVPSKVQLSLDLMESPEKLPGTDQAEDDYVPSWTTLYSDESSQGTLEVTSGGPEIFEVWKYSGNNPRYSLKRLLTHVPSDSESFQVKTRETFDKMKTEWALVTPSSSDSGNYLPTGMVGKGPMDTLEAHSRGKSPQGGGSVSACHVKLAAQPCSTPLENSDAQLETWQVPMKASDTSKCPSQDLFILDPSTQKVLEAHIKRFWVRHRWSLPLKIIKPANVLKQRKAPLVPLAPPNLASLAWHSKAQSFTQCVTTLGQTAQNAAGEAVTSETSVHFLECPLPDPSFQSLRVSAPGDKCGPSQTPPAAQGGSSSPSCIYGFVGRTWHKDSALRSVTGSLELSSSSGRDWREVQRPWGVASDASCRSTSVREVSAGSQYSKSEEIRELEDEDDDQESPDSVVITRERLTADFKTIHVTPRNPESLGTSQSSSPFMISVSQGLGVPGRKARPVAEKQRQSSTHKVILQDCTSGLLLQDCPPEVLLATDIQGSQASLSGPQSLSGSSSSTQQELYSLLSTAGSSQLQEPKVPTPGDPWESNWNMLGLITHVREDGGRPKPGGQGGRLAEERPAAAQLREDRLTKGGRSSLGLPEEAEARSETQLANKIKNFLQCNIPSKRRESAGLMHKPKPPPPSAATQSSGPAVGQPCGDSSSVKNQGLMTMLGRILEEKMGLHRERSVSKEKMHNQKSQAPAGPGPHSHRGPGHPEQRHGMKEVSRIQHSGPQGHNHCMKTKDKEGNLVWPPGAPRNPASTDQQRPRGQGVSGRQVHCPRHCLLRRNLLSGQSFHIGPSGKTFPQENFQVIERESVSHVNPPSEF